MVDLLKRGSVAGFSAGVAVAAGVLVYDLFNLQPLATPDALARNLMGGPVFTEANLGVVEWIANAQNKRTGGWEIRDHDLQNSFHATICAVDALITPTMDGSAPLGKVNAHRAGVRTSKRQREREEEEERRRRRAREDAPTIRLFPWEQPHPLEEE